ncbi:helix-turn-helix domain-containing protein [Planotetraspora kaengkrachanensis]|uniref:Transcriptional regulator n=1 Tax=Planotetraspora kaengkrachanensis TaxID=575193 RepID=A0A8J3Q0G6_9ACTN|nr:helix-turn-helix domain-containing protein [Planotetraspora kaengkrachanensis]GIG84619.1 transcriptional regulator [Planotetraspora kaengkrachanensis]
MNAKKPLGDFLRARRQVTSVDQAGLARGGPRRIPGLRREEVATLAGVSTDYYIRLEQGRERHPSDQVLQALARVFGLTTDATEHMFELASPRAHRHRTCGTSDQISAGVLRLLDRWDHAPAFVVNHRLDVLARNHLSRCLVAGQDLYDNLLRFTFLNPASREFYLDWEREALAKVADLRAGAAPEDPAVLELVEELSQASEDFRRMWARHDVLAKADEPKRLHHPVAGDLILWHETFCIASTPGLRIFISTAEPGSPSERALARLARLGPGGRRVWPVHRAVPDAESRTEHASRDEHAPRGGRLRHE